MLGLCFIVLLERGPGREHITVQSYMLALVAGLGAIFAGILAIEPVREFFELELLSGGQWFLALLCVAIGLGIAGAAWRLPYVQRLELRRGRGARARRRARADPHARAPASSTRCAAVRRAAPTTPDPASEAPTTVAPPSR